jgi:uncharacterized protein (TIGR03437 family)
MPMEIAVWMNTNNATSGFWTHYTHADFSRAGLPMNNNWDTWPLGYLEVRSNVDSVGTRRVYRNADQQRPLRVPEPALALQGTLEFRVSAGPSGEAFGWRYGYEWRGTAPAPVTLESAGGSIGAAGGAGNIAVTAPAGSGWRAVTTADWIRIDSGASGSGNGAVGFSASANTGPPRTATISIGDQTYTVNQGGTPEGVTAGCNYLVQPSAQTAANTGGNGLIQVITAPTCAWTATSNEAWLTIRSGASGTGNGAVSWAASANADAKARTAALIIAGQAVTVNQAGSAPAVSSGGVVNTASYRKCNPPDGTLAQGAFFSIYGSDLGPEQFVQAGRYPIPTTLGGATVTFTQGNTRRDAYLVFVSRGQINGILSSDFPLGDALMTVSYNGRTSPPAPVRISRTDLGLFFQRIDGRDIAIAQNVASATDYPLNTVETPAKPGQIVILWGTGLGAIARADNVAPGGGDMPVAVEITVGGKQARRLYAGRQPETAAVDNVYFEVPADAPFGCFVPVQVNAGGANANPVVIAITADGRPCQ